MATLSRAAATIEPPAPQIAPKEIAARETLKERRLSSVPQDPQFAWTSAVLFILVISGLSGGLALLATSPTQPVKLDVNPIVQSAAAREYPASPASPTSPAEENAQVLFTNPFDASEVFEFPSGTTEAEARATVASLLIQRANDRQNTWKTLRQRRKTANQVAPAAPISLARRS